MFWKNFKYIDYNENSVPLESEEGLKIIDKWVDKWGYIIRSLKKCTNNISSHLSGGFDSRAVLSILLNSGIDLNDILIISLYAKKKRYKEDFYIAKNISSKFGFKLNNFRNNNSSRTRLSPEVSFFCSIYSKLGFHSGFTTPTYFFNYPKFTFCGFGGENIRGYPGYPINKYIDKISRGYKQFYNSSIRLCNRSIALLKKKKSYSNDYEICSDLYLYGRTRNHYGKTSLEYFLANEYYLQPLIDPDIKQIKYEISEKSIHDLISYIYVRFSHDLVYFPFEGNRFLKQESIKYENEAL